MSVDLGMGLLSGVGSLISGLGARQAAKSQQRRQQAAEYLATIQNQAAVEDQNRKRQELVSLQNEARNQYGALQNAANERLGREMLTGDYRGVDIMSMVSDAKRAGFNPITYLQSGAAAYYDKGRNVVEAFNMMRPDYMSMMPDFSGAVPDRVTYGVGQVVNVPSVAQAVGGALSAGVSTYTDWSKMTRQENLQYALQNQKLDFLKGENALNRALRQAMSGGKGGSGGSGSGGGSGGTTGSNPFGLKNVGPFPDNSDVQDAYTIPGYGMWRGLTDYFSNRPGYLGGAVDMNKYLKDEGYIKDAQQTGLDFAKYGAMIMGWGPYSKGFWSGDPVETYKAAKEWDRQSMPAIKNWFGEAFKDQQMYLGAP